MAGRRLSQQQRGRIGQLQEQRRQRLAQEEPEGEVKGAERAGEVVVRYGHHFIVAAEERELLRCRSRANIGHPVCGDRVVWQQSADDEGVIVALLPRSSVLARPDFSGREKPLAANIDQLIILIAPQPEPVDYLIDQYLLSAEVMGVNPTLAINKIDLLGEGEAAFLARYAHYLQIGYPLITVSARLEHGLDPLRASLQGHTGILVGQSGVGKSSLINALLPDLEVQVGRLSAATGQGCHTTSATTLYQLPAGGRLIDSPGVRSFRLLGLTREQLAWGFREFRHYLGSCRFANCRHDQEPGCALKEAVAAGEIHPARLQNFLHMMREQSDGNRGGASTTGRSA